MAHSFAPYFHSQPCVYLYIYIQGGREREGEREREKKKKRAMYNVITIYIPLYKPPLNPSVTIIKHPCSTLQKVASRSQFSVAVPSFRRHLQLQGSTGAPDATLGAEGHGEPLGTYGRCVGSIGTTATTVSERGQLSTGFVVI